MVWPLGRLRSLRVLLPAAKDAIRLAGVASGAEDEETDRQELREDGKGVEGDGMTYQEYAKLPGLTASALKAGAVSMKHMKHYLEHGVPQTSAMLLGSAVHSMLAGTLSQDAALWTGGTRRANGYAEFALLAKQQGRYVLTNEEMEDAKRIWRAFFDDREAFEALRGCSHEVVIQWEATEYGAGKARLDHDFRGRLVEVKTTSKIASFPAEFYNRGYDIQVGWYWHGAGRPENVKVVAVETAPPYDVAVYQMGRDVLEPGYARAVEIAKTWRVAQATGFYGGVTGGQVQQFVPPRWAVRGDMTVTEEGAE